MALSCAMNCGDRPIHHLVALERLDQGRGGNRLGVEVEIDLSAERRHKLVHRWHRGSGKWQAEFHPGTEALHRLCGRLANRAVPIGRPV
jgi:hypothetical protein